ncbi:MULTISPECIES: type II secretion system F family protein [unclassified Sedimentibacter]|uniref:type II secretion system F family protein n=1 Tax=unclassified Sedimentibacter TaxID=2649220 RepID=UPI0027E0B59B|nr:type II secretion system F family protein [Sedimentibacter sp. MB35-C1]WMJ76675.1 type II secretion system F family protein [Sedimentibacter sp. MB35-C1]
MAVYKCSVVDQSGKRQRINKDASTKAEMIDYLKQNNYVIIDIKQSAGSVDLSSISGKRIKSKDLAVFCKQLYAMLKAGVTIVNSLDILKQQTENKRLSKIISQMYDDLQKGNTFSEALSHHKDTFPAIFISMVEAGELSGNIDIIMNRLANHFEKEYKIENKVKGAMTYPIILAVVCVAVVIFLLTTIMPTFVEMYSSSGVELPKITQIMIAISEALKSYWYIIVMVAVGLAFAVSAMNKNSNIKLKEDYYKLQIPVVKNLVLKVATSRFTRTLSTLMGSGVPLLQALETVAGVTGNTYIGSKIMEAREDVRRGLALSQPLRQQGVFPPMVHSMIKIGEDSGSIEEILDKTADFYDEEVDTAVTRLTTMLEPVMIVFMAVIIGFIVISMVTPMFDMVKTVQ